MAFGSGVREGCGVLVNLGRSVKVGSGGCVAVSVGWMAVLVGRTSAGAAVVSTIPRVTAVAVSSAGLTYPCEHASMELSSTTQAAPTWISLVTDLVFIDPSIP